MAFTTRLLAAPAYMVVANGQNIFTPSWVATSTAFDTIKHIHLANEDSSSRTVSLFLGATGGYAAGTELLSAFVIGANNVYDWWGAIKLTNTNSLYLSGYASVGSKVVIMVEGESGFVQ